LLFVLFSARVCGQSCRCGDEFVFLQGYMEKNYAGFRDKVNAGNRVAYDSMTASLYRRAVSIGKPGVCLALMRQWLGFFRDAHNYLSEVAPARETGLAATHVVVATRVVAAVQARQLSDQTLYIGIASFGEENAAAIDSLLKADSALLRTSPNLIIDVRGNGGGSDFSYEPLMPLLYTDPVHGIGVDVLATADNIKSWSSVLDDKYISGWTRFSVQNKIAAMKAHPGGWVSITPDLTATRREVRAFPHRIVILIDSGCASTTEQFLLEAMQSRKVTLMGQHTEGVLDYSNVRDVPLSCMPFTLHYATTRSRRIDAGKGIDNIGLQPGVVFGDGVDWVEAARKYLEEGR